MCGIYGQIAAGPARQECGASIQHRGPDDSGMQVLAVPGTGLDVSLVHQRLAIIDLSPAGHQPMANEDGSIWIVFNGEIYNYLELRAELISAGHCFKSNSDTETIVHGYEEWGNGVIPRLRGMFSLAIWDQPRRKLLLTRDRIGKKPLFYYAGERSFYFCSEIKGLFASGAVPAEPDPAALHDYLTYLYFPPPRTAYKNIFKLPPATLLEITVGPGGRLIRKQQIYWDAADAVTSPGAPTYSDALEQTRALMEEAVKIRLMSDVPLGVCLSGGLDSGAITAFAARNSDQPVRTFSIGFSNNRAFDEIAQANEIAKMYATNHRVIQVKANSAEHIATVVRHFDEPFGNPTAILEYILTREMRNDVTVALSGDGGDEVFGGYVRYGGAWLASKYRKLPEAFVKSFVAPLSRLLREDTTGRHTQRRVREFLESAWRPQQEMYLSWVGYFSEAEKHELYTPAFAASIGGHDSSEFMREIFRKGEQLEPLNRLGYVDLASFLTGNCLEYADRMSMANSLEVRCPFTDHRLVEFGLSLPFSWKYRVGQTKRIVREAMRGILPESVLKKKKMGFNPPLPAWLTSELKPMIADLLSRERIERRGIFRPSAVERLLSDHSSGRRDNALKIWALMMLEVWYQMYIDPLPGERAERWLESSSSEALA